MNSDSIESIALHIMRHLVRGLDKTQGHGASVQNLRRWWILSLGQRSESFELGLHYASHHQWVEHGPDDMVLLTGLGSTKGSASR
jgi:hypothetical protein